VAGITFVVTKLTVAIMATGTVIAMVGIGVMADGSHSA
jgi:hypothetical protein